MTLNGVIAVFALFQRIRVAFASHGVKVVEDIRKFSGQECSPEFLVFSDISLPVI